MVRDLTRLRQAAAAVAADLSGTLGSPWTVEVGAGYALAISDGAHDHQVVLQELVAAGNWPAEAWSERYLTHTLDDDAYEVVMTSVTEAMSRAWEMSWPICPEHDSALTNCSGMWVCGRPPAGAAGHDVAVAGKLTSALAVEAGD